MFCQKCGEIISLLGLRDRETGFIQYVCSNSECNTVWLKNNNGLVFDRDEVSKSNREEDALY